MTAHTHFSTTLRLLLAAALAWHAAFIRAQHLSYDLTFSPDRHYINVTLKATGLDNGQTLFKMPVWAPGDYDVKNYPKNLCDFRVADAEGNSVEWEKQRKNGWLVKNGRQKDVTITYRIFANKQDLAEAQVDTGRAFVPGNGVFLYLEGRKDLPATVTLHPDRRWKHVTTTLEPVEDKANTFRAKDADELYDSPFLLGNHRIEEKQWYGKRFVFAIETPEGIDSTDFFSDVKKIIGSTHQLFDEIPFDRYCFFILGKGDGGLEHAYSQVDFTKGSFRFDNRDEYLRFLFLIAHEYYHLYNVKRIRPIELGPFDYDQENFTAMLWVSEGITMHYETELLLRPGIITEEEALAKLSGFVRRIETKEGHRHMSLRQSAYDIWLNFMTDNDNEDEVSINFYFKGPIVAKLMDIRIRQLTHGTKCLDDVMRRLYYDYYKKADRGFTEEEFWDACRLVAGRPLTEMRRLVDTTDEIDYPRLLAPGGLTIDKDYNIRQSSVSGKNRIR